MPSNLRRACAGAALTLCLSACSAANKIAPNLDERYSAAVAGAEVCKTSEILPLIELRDGENLLISWNSFPDTFTPGQAYTATEDLELWCVSYDEMKSWVLESGSGVTDWTTRLEQLIGLPSGFCGRQGCNGRLLRRMAAKY